MENKLSIVCVSAAREKLQMTAMVASVAAASGSKVRVFFSMNSILHFVSGSNIEVPAEGEFASLLTTEGVPEFKNLFQMAVELGDVELLPCSMALELANIKDKDLDLDFAPATGLTKFLSDAEGGQLLSF
jgi:peroxiredoxin family protein